VSESNIIALYRNGTSRERVELLYRYYSEFEYVLSSYRTKLIEEIREQKIYNCRSQNGDIGVRVQTSTCGDPTFKMAILNDEIETMIDTKRLSESILEGVDSREETVDNILNLWMMQDHYQIFRQHVIGISKKKNRLLFPYISGKKTVDELADDFSIEPESVRQSLYRTKKLLVAQTEPYFENRRRL